MLLCEANPLNRVDAFEVRYEGRKDKEFGRREWDQLLGHCMVSLWLCLTRFAP